MNKEESIIDGIQRLFIKGSCGVAKKLLALEHEWLENDIIKRRER